MRHRRTVDPPPDALVVRPPFPDRASDAAKSSVDAIAATRRALSPRRNSHAHETSQRGRSPSPGRAAEAAPSGMPPQRIAPLRAGASCHVRPTGPDIPQVRPTARKPRPDGSRPPGAVIDAGNLYHRFWGIGKDSPFFRHFFTTFRGPCTDFLGFARHNLGASFAIFAVFQGSSSKFAKSPNRKLGTAGAGHKKRTAPKPAPSKSVLETEKTLTSS